MKQSLVKDVDQFDFTAAYVFLIKKKWAPMIISELVMLNLRVTEMQSKI
jgi:hypothetical protein